MRILFLCLGNICRSPAAEAIARAKAAQAGLAVEFDSAGTGDWHVGAPPYGPMIEAARARGYGLDDLRARQLVPADWHAFDLILAMDKMNLRDALNVAPPGPRAGLQLFLGPQFDRRDVPDPYFTRDFDAALDLIEAGAEALVAEIAAHPEAKG